MMLHSEDGIFSFGGCNVVRAIPAVGCVRVRVVCWVGNGSRDLPKGSSMGATLAFRRTGMCIAPPTWHMRCAAWYYKYRCMLFCNPSSRESGTLVITESFGLRHQEEPCACGEPRVSQDNSCARNHALKASASKTLRPFFQEIEFRTRRHQLSQETNHPQWRLPKWMTAATRSFPTGRLRTVRTTPLTERVS